MASVPKLAHCTTGAEGYLALHIGSDLWFFINRKHRGNPWRELAMFTQAELDASQLGSIFFDLPVRQIILPDRSFSLFTGFNPTGNVARLFWNSGGSSEIRRFDVDVSTLAFTASVVLPFQGRDPFVVDARAGTFPNRIIMAYIKDGGMYWRQSLDLGITWSAEREIDAAFSGITELEASIKDPATKHELKVLQNRT